MQDQYYHPNLTPPETAAAVSGMQEVPLELAGRVQTGDNVVVKLPIEKVVVNPVMTPELEGTRQAIAEVIDISPTGYKEARQRTAQAIYDLQLGKAGARKQGYDLRDELDALDKSELQAK
jgi:hypothetical protein